MDVILKAGDPAIANCLLVGEKCKDLNIELHEHKMVVNLKWDKFNLCNALVAC